jgi:predicted MFS family arabinose efflux permease
MTGNAELLANPRIRGLFLAQWLPVWFITGAEALIIPYTAAHGYPPSAASPLLAAVPIGMLIGDVTVGRFCRAAVRERLAFPLAVLVGAPLLIAAVQPPLPVIGAVLFLSGLGCSYQLGIQKAFLDSLSPELRGRGFGLRAAGELGGEGLVPSAIGGIASALGIAGAIAVAGAAGVIAAVSLHGPLSPAATQPDEPALASAEQSPGTRPR